MRGLAREQTRKRKTTCETTAAPAAKRMEKGKEKRRVRWQPARRQRRKTAAKLARADNPTL
jgi:hypothetical protein